MPIAIFPEVEQIAAHLQGQLGGAWREAMVAIIEHWEELERAGRLNANTARGAIQEVLAQWPALTARAYDELIDRIFTVGFAFGVTDTGVRSRPDSGDEAVIDWLKQGPNGFIPALRGMADDGRKGLEKVIGEAYAGRDELGERRPFDLDDMVARALEQVSGLGETRAELIIRTETAKATALGRISAWGNDPYRDHYWYHWIATPDDRVKDVSLKFEGEGPYDYNEIKHRWEVDHNNPQLVRNRRTGQMERQVSAFNCRCTVARTPKEPVELFREGKIDQDTFEHMEAA